MSASCFFFLVIDREVLVRFVHEETAIKNTFLNIYF